MPLLAGAGRIAFDGRSQEMGHEGMLLVEVTADRAEAQFSRSPVRIRDVIGAEVNTPQIRQPRWRGRLHRAAVIQCEKTPADPSRLFANRARPTLWPGCRPGSGAARRGESPEEIGDGSLGGKDPTGRFAIRSHESASVSFSRTPSPSILRPRFGIGGVTRRWVCSFPSTGRTSRTIRGPVASHPVASAPSPGRTR